MTMTMRLVLAFTATLMLFSNSVAFANDRPLGAGQPPISDVMKPVDNVLAAIANDKVQTLEGAYTNDATVIDDQAPFHWTGPQAGTNWFSAITTYGKMTNTHFTVIADPANVELSSNTAYAVVPAIIRGVGPRSGLITQGVLAFSLRKVGDVWKISGQSWTANLPAKVFR